MTPYLTTEDIKARGYSSYGSTQNSQLFTHKYGQFLEVWPGAVGKPQAELTFRHGLLIVSSQKFSLHEKTLNVFEGQMLNAIERLTKDGPPDGLPR